MSNSSLILAQERKTSSFDICSSEEEKFMIDDACLD